MDALAKFTFADPTGDDVIMRTAGTPDAPLFCVKDVCKCLGIADHKVKARLLDQDEKVGCPTPSRGGTQEMIFCTGPGLSNIVLSCRNVREVGSAPYAFRRWVTHEVLESIRKTGGYNAAAPPPAPRLPPTMETQLAMAQFLTGGYKDERALLGANDARARDEYSYMIKSVYDRTAQVYCGGGVDPMMIEDQPGQLLTVSEVMAAMGPPYSTYACQKEKAKVGRLVAATWRAQFPAKIAQTMKTLAGGHKASVNCYSNHGWVEGVVRQFFSE